MTKVVVQVNKAGDDYYKKVLNNIINLKNKLGDQLVECEIVLFGEGLPLLLSEDEAIRNQITKILEKDIQFIVCNNTLTRLNVQTEDLACSVNAAGSGVAHLVTRQTEGWAYLAL
ncbi:DsrE family protein [Alkalihalobacillus deserti]|uniref:DsrE family protein n=1 Tax=Alkalihalobacillus deserti TaxID=2879466 RepID=UPI001D133862|nr:DsrE family protein [Alkalihalobacillus deserti]